MDAAFTHLTVNQDVALEFLAVFSRFEFALKVTGFRKPGDGEAKADWITFAAEVAGAFDPSRTEEIREAFGYVAGQPLRRLAVKNGRLGWFPFTVPPGISEAERVVRLVRQVRNNLFHGGKFAPDRQAKPGRDSRLIECSMVLLRELLKLSPQVQMAYVD